MTRLIFLLALPLALLLQAAPVLGQDVPILEEEDEEQVADETGFPDFGITVGMNTPTYYTDPGHDMVFNKRNGSRMGTFVQFKLEESIYFQPGMYFSQKGALITVLPSDDRPLIQEEVSVRWETTYWEFPLLLKMDLFGERSLTPHAAFGPSFNFATSSNRTVLADQGGQVNDEALDVLGRTTLFDLGSVYQLGLTYNLPVGSQLFVNAGYQVGSTRVFTFFDQELKNTGFEFNIGFVF